MDESGRAEGRRKRYDLERHLGQDAHKGLAETLKYPSKEPHYALMAASSQTRPWERLRSPRY